MGAETASHRTDAHRARWALASLAAGLALLAEGVVAERFHVGAARGVGWGRIALLAGGTILTAAGLVAMSRSGMPRPSRVGAGRLARAWWPLLVALAVYLGAFLVINPISTGDQPHYELESMTLAYDQSRNLAHSYANVTWTQLVYPSRGLSPAHEAIVYTNKHVLIHGANVGPAVVLAAAVPWVELARSLNPADGSWPWNIEMLILAAIAAQLLYRLLRRFRPRAPGLTTAVWACTVFCAPMVVYSSQIYPEVPAMLLALILADCLTRKPTTTVALVGSAAAAALPWIHVRFFLVSVLLVLALALRAATGEPGRARSAKPLLRALAPVLVPYAVSTAVMAVAFQAWYGSPLLSAPYRTPQISESHTLLASYLAFANLFWSSHFGLIPVAPVVLLMLVATPLFCRRYGRWALFALAVAAVYVATVTFEGSEIGFSFSGRYMVWLIPFGSVPLLFLVTEYPIARWAFEAFAAVMGWLAVSVVLEPPATVSSNIALKPLSGRFMDIWPAVSQTGFANIWAVAAWTAGVLAVAAAVCAAEARVRRPAVAARIGAASRA